MRVRTQELGCLAHKAYLVDVGGEAMVIDPPRDVDAIVKLVESEGLKLKYVVESHLHADFVSGHVELAQRTGATIVLSSAATASFPFHAAQDGELLPLGGLRIEVIHTPGHTPFDMVLWVTDPAKPEEAGKLFTGDTLFYGDIGRPDLVASVGFTQEDMAGMMYRSLHESRFKDLPDSAEVYPAHGAGSACGKAIADLASSTLGEQRQMNWALQPTTREAFILAAVSGLSAAPAYFGHDAKMNQQGATPLADLVPAQPLAPEALAAVMKKSSTFVLDVRDGDAYAAAHVPGSVNIDLDGNFAPWVGAAVPVDAELHLVFDTEAQHQEARTRLARVGFDRVLGFLDGGVAAWVASGRPTASLPSFSPEAIAAKRAEGVRVLDVRGPGEFQEAHLAGAMNLPLPELNRRMAEVPAGPLVVHCAGGYRSRVAWGLLARAGHEAVDLAGGIKAWQAEGMPVVLPEAVGV